MNPPATVKIREVGPRDGFQSWPELVPTDKKLEVIRSLMAAGVKEIETTSFVSPKAVPQMADAAKVMAAVPREGVKHAALVPNLKGAQLALEAGVDQLMVVISASEAHNMANFRRTIADSLADLEPIFSLAAEKGVEVFGATAVAFGCPYQGEVPEADVLKLVAAYVDYGAHTLGLADTTGMATPPRVESLVSQVKERYPDKDLMLHLHNNRGTAMTNLYVGMMAGATIFDTALGGIGGCPNVPQASGNLATEDVVYMLEEMGVETGIDLAALIKAARDMEKILGRMLPGQVMKSGPRDPKLASEICGIH